MMMLLMMMLVKGINRSYTLAWSAQRRMWDDCERRGGGTLLRLH